MPVCPPTRESVPGHLRGPAHAPDTGPPKALDGVLPHDPSHAQRLRVHHAAVTRHRRHHRTRQSSPSPSIPLLPTCPFPSWRLSTAPATVDCQNAIAKRATCHTLSPPAINRNCFPRRSRVPAQPHSGLAHDAAVPSPLTSFLCTTPAHGATVRHAGLTERSLMPPLPGPDGGGRRAHMLTPAPCAARCAAVSLTESTSSRARTEG